MNLELLNTTIDNINIFVAFFSFLLALGQLLVKNKQWFNYIISIIFFCFGIMNLDFALLLNGTLSSYPHLFAVSWPFHCFIMPAAYLYIKMMVTHDFKPSRKHLLFFLPGLINFIILVPTVYVKSAHEKIAFLADFNLGNYNNSFLMYSYVAITTLKLFFVILTLYESRFLWSRDKIKNVSLFRIIFILYLELILAYIINLVSIFMESTLILRIDSLLFNQIVFMPFLLSYRYPDIMHNLSIEFSREKYKQSQTKGINIDSILLRLNELFKIEKIFTDPELNINSVSEKLEISSHQLSEIINKKLHVNFRSLINNYRIEEARALLINQPDDTILKTAYAVGFNSKTAFNNAFLNITAMTPSEYRKKNLKYN